jgi:diguanylate cyclase (GGDEF)-like protein
MAVGEAAYVWDLRADRMTWFGAAHKLFGDAPPPGDSKSFYDAIHADDRHLIFGTEAPTIDRQFRLGGQTTGREARWVHERGVVESEKGHPTVQRGFLRLIEKSTAHWAEESDKHDPLTGCLERRSMLGQLTKAIYNATESRRTAAYLVIGIDKMSFVNEAMGMGVGDALLRGVAERLRSLVHSRALIGRVGGDMFGVLLPAPFGQDFKTVGIQIVENFRNQPVMAADTPLHITISAGGVRLPAAAKNATEAMIFAEQAQHDARGRGRNQFVEYADAPERAKANRELLALNERIKHALKNDGLFLAYQPVIDAASGQTLFFEALVRMRGDDGQLIPAAMFVPAMEQLGLAVDLDRIVLDLSVKTLEARPDLTLSVNVSSLTASQADWPDHVRRVLMRKPGIAKRVILEITETAAIVDIAETQRLVDTLRSLGGRVALDDFGAGFTSIRYLRTLGLAIMKIDKELLHDLAKHADQQHLVRMLIELARGLNLKTVAEGVETAEVAAWLRREQVDMMQGYYFAAPSLELPPAEGIIAPSNAAAGSETATPPA